MSATCRTTHSAKGNAIALTATDHHHRNHPMRSYPRNSPQAAARIVALLLIADGHVSRSEMDALYGRDIEHELGPRTCSKSF